MFAKLDDLPAFNYTDITKTAETLYLRLFSVFIVISSSGLVNAYNYIYIVALLEKIKPFNLTQ